MDKDKKKRLLLRVIHALLYISGLALMVLMYVLHSKTLCFIGLILLFFAVLLTFIKAVRRIKEAGTKRRE